MEGLEGGMRGKQRDASLEWSIGSVRVVTSEQKRIALVMDGAEPLHPVLPLRSSNTDLIMVTMLDFFP